MADKGMGKDRKQFDKELSSYISARRKKDSGLLKSVSSMFKSSEDVTVKLHPDVESYGPNSGEHPKEEKEAPKEEKEEITDEEMEYLEEEFDEGSKPGFFDKLKGMFFEEAKSNEGEISPDDVERVIEENKKEETEEIAPEEEADTDVEEEYTGGAREKGIITKFIEKLFGKAQEEKNVCADEIAEAIEAVDDLKKVAEISTTVMKMLPPQKVKELKESEDFRHFKGILKKHNLIK